MSGHTPGPWRAEPFFRNGCMTGVKVETPDVVVAWCPNDAPSSDTEATEAVLADARLIAAAPQMLETLRGAVARLEEQEWSAWRSSDGGREDFVGAECCPECAGMKDLGHEMVCGLATTLTAARAAIAAGEGREP